MTDSQFADGLLWLASYPKSGNTWFRAFLSALLGDGKVEINNMNTDCVFSSRDVFEGITDIDSRYLYTGEAKAMMADVYRQYAHTGNKLRIVKVHDAFEHDLHGINIIPEDVTHCAIYFIRNPLDIVGSFANHQGMSIDAAVKVMNNPKATLAGQKDNLNRNPQFTQDLSDWSGHVKSWTLKPAFPVLVLRYEDMLTHPLEAFSTAVKFIGWQYSHQEVQAALDASSFERLSEQEVQKGFLEKDRKSPIFFRSGKMGNWEKELSKEQIDMIIAAHEHIMKKYRYL